MKNKILITAFAVIILILGGVIMAHNKVYVFCENMCMEEGMTKDQIGDNFSSLSTDLDIMEVNLNNYVEALSQQIVDINSRIDMKMLEGRINVVAGQIPATQDIDYPDEFGPNNTIVLSTMTTSGVGANSIYGYPSNATLGNVSDPRVILNKDKIQLQIPHNLSDGTVTLVYKILLLRVN